MFSELFGNLTAFDVTKEEYPSNPADFDLFIITGSKFSCYENLPWITKLKEFVKRHDDGPIKFFGVCFGHQIIAEALGGKGSLLLMQCFQMPKDGRLAGFPWN